MSRWSFVKMLYRWPTAAWVQAWQNFGQRMEKELPQSLPRANMALGKKVAKLLGYANKYRAHVHSWLLPSAARKSSSL